MPGGTPDIGAPQTLCTLPWKKLSSYYAELERWSLVLSRFAQSCSAQPTSAAAHGMVGHTAAPPPRRFGRKDHRRREAALKSDKQAMDVLS